MPIVRHSLAASISVVTDSVDLKADETAGGSLVDLLVREVFYRNAITHYRGPNARGPSLRSGSFCSSLPARNNLSKHRVATR